MAQNSVRAALILLAVLVTPATAHAQDITVHLLFDGQPLATTTSPEFSCHEDNLDQWMNCTVIREPDADAGEFVMTRPAPGLYTLHVEINENQDNPARFPGDYDVFQQFTVTSAGPAALDVNMPKLMRTTFPWDNDQDLDGMLTRHWPEKPVIETLRQSPTHTARVTFKWDAVVPVAQYDYVVRMRRDDPFELGPIVFSGTTSRTSVTLRLPLSPPGRYFAMELLARHNGRQVGRVFTHDAGVQAWTTEFIVRDWSGQHEDVALDPVVNDEAFLDEWKQAIPPPAWWDDVPPSPRAINSLGDLLSLWQTGTNDEASRRRFYKLAYQAILDHSSDQHLVAAAIDLMPYAADPDQRFPLLKFGVDHFFSYNQRTEICANCMIGDQSGAMVRDLADAYIGRGEPETAIRLIQRLVNEREADISAYNLALTFQTMARAYWEMKDVGSAKAALQEGLRRFPTGWQADQLRETLQRYETTTP